MHHYLRFLLGTYFVFAALNLAAQEGSDPEIQKLLPQKIEHVHQINLSKLTQDWTADMRNVTVVQGPEIGSEKARIQQIKSRKTQRLLENRGQVQTTSTRAGVQPILLAGFPGNGFGGGLPNDDNLAASPSGYIVHATNSIMIIYDANGQRLLNTGLAQFGYPVDTLARAFDPRVMFDAAHDRWILVYDSGSRPGRNSLIVAFSQTNDPTQDWNIYNINGNLRPGGIDVWCDFPQIGISSDELFISGNLFGNSGFESAGLWQMSLTDGYAGNPTQAQPFLINRFGLVPVTGIPNLYGPKMHFLNKSRFGGDNGIRMYEITNTIANNGQLRLARTVRSSAFYDFPPNAPQKSAPVGKPDQGALDTGFGGIQNAYLHQNKIHFSMASDVRGRPGIYYGKIEIPQNGGTNYSLTTRLISLPNLYIGYPTISFGGQEDAATGEHSQFFFFNYTSDETFPGNAILYLDECGELSDPLILRTANTFISASGTVGGDTRNRWGDYAGVAYTAPGEIWVAGYDTNPSHQHISWISWVLADPAQGCAAVGTRPEVASPKLGLKAYPSPAREMIWFDFEVEETGLYHAKVVDAQGRFVRSVMKDQLRSGVARARFNTSLLPSAMYYIVVEGEDGRIFSEKFVVRK